MQEIKRVREVLELQGLLDSMGSDATRSDFQTGKHGAIVSSVNKRLFKKMQQMFLFEQCYKAYDHVCFIETDCIGVCWVV